MENSWFSDLPEPHAFEKHRENNALSELYPADRPNH
jgi:hypothetical protein